MSFFDETSKYEILAGSPTFSFTDDQVTATVLLKVGNANVEALFDELYPGNFSASMSFEDKAQYPGKPFLRVDTVGQVPFDTEVGPAANTSLAKNSSIIPGGDGSWRITINYKTRPSEEEDECENNPPEGPNIEYTVDIGADIMTIPNSGLEWEVNDDNAKKFVAADLQAGIMIPMLEHNFTLTNVAQLPTDRIREAMGKVNDSGFKGGDAEAVMFAGATVSKNRTPIGNTVYTVTYRFLERHIVNSVNATVGWNKFYRSKPAAGQEHWQTILTLEGEKLYAQTSFDNLFNLPPLNDGGDPCDDR